MLITSKALSDEDHTNLDHGEIVEQATVKSAKYAIYKISTSHLPVFLIIRWDVNDHPTRSEYFDYSRVQGMMWYWAEILRGDSV